jgi:hypothetical protein
MRLEVDMRLPAIVLALILTMAAAVSAFDSAPTPVQDNLRLAMQTGDTRSLLAPAGDQPVSGTGALSDDHGRKSSKKAALYSALLPGLGEYYVGHKKKARYFFAAEAMSWIAFFGFRTYANWKEDDYINLARLNAGIDLEGRPDWLVDFVAFYDDIHQYNELGRALDRSRPYLEDNADNHWAWDSPDDKAAFRQIKNRADEFQRRATFAIGAMVVLRIASVIDAIHDANRSGKRLDDIVERDRGRLDYRVEAGPEGENFQVGVTLVKRF